MQIVVTIVLYAVGYDSLGGSLPNVIGFLTFGIIGVILLIVGYRRKRNKNNNEKKR